jgi:hypothetical protein
MANFGYPNYALWFHVHKDFYAIVDFSVSPKIKKKKSIKKNMTNI